MCIRDRALGYNSKEFEKLKQLSDEFLKQEENNELVEEANEEEEEIVIEPK